jgi:ferredoxin-NADP reductase
MELAVTSIRRATPTTRVVRLALGDARFRFRAGQAALLGAPGGGKLAPYSVASSPEDVRETGALEFLVKPDPSSRFAACVTTLRRGDRVKVGGPVGSFTWPDRPRERHFLFVAGGTGITPLRSMIRHAIAVKQPGRLRLLYAARARAEFAYLPEFRRLAREGALDLTLTITRQTGGRWRHGRGRPGADVLRPLVDDPATLCFLCGPSAMVVELSDVLRSFGIAAHRIRSERW